MAALLLFGALMAPSFVAEIPATGWVFVVAADVVFHLVALTIAVSIVAHSSTDIIVARWFDDRSSPPHCRTAIPCRGSANGDGWQVTA